jgi:hypothetical protein
MRPRATRLYACMSCSRRVSSAATHPRNMSDHFFASAKRRSARLFFFAARSSRDAGRSSSFGALNSSGSWL